MKKYFSTNAVRTIKSTYRLLRYKTERIQLLRNIKSASKQNINIKKYYNSEERNLIVFLIPGADIGTGKNVISGGLISIASLYQETLNLEHIHGCKTIMCTFPREHLLNHLSNFNNNIFVYRFSQIRKYFKLLDKLIIHVPEFLVPYFLHYLSNNDITYFRKIKNVQINILNQNIRLMPNKEIIESLKCITNSLTITTAHEKYSTKEHREFYGIPLHFFSTFASPEDYDFVSYENKRNLLLFSPDDEVKNKEIIEILKIKIPDLECRIIRNLKYEEYKKLIRDAKWCITFGEGLDFYFIEPVFSGGISFAIYNELFFTKDFQNIKTVFESFKNLKDDIFNKLIELDNKENYYAEQKRVMELCSIYYNKRKYKQNIENFYKGLYTFQ